MKIPFTISDKSDRLKGREISGDIEVDDDGISIRFDGYGTKTAIGNEGQPIYIEIWDDQLSLRVWDDINEEDPVSISLEEAKIENYRGEKDES